jgi:hypothetical protein
MQERGYAMENEHDLGDCEQWWGYTCEECRQEYQERMVEWAMEDAMEEKYK